MKRIVLSLVVFCVAMSFPLWAAQVTQLVKLLSPRPINGGTFGSGVAISGGTIAVGQASAARSGEGQVYLYLKESGRSPAASLGDGGWNTGFGYAVAMTPDTNTIVVGAPAGPSSAVYVFIKPPGGWTGGFQNLPPTARLSVASGQRFLGCGVAVSSDGKTVVAGAIGAGEQPSGAVYVFVEPDAGWLSTTVPTATLLATSSFNLGNVVAMTDDTIVAGSTDFSSTPGHAYLFVKPPTGWQDGQPTATLTPSDGSMDDQFGASVAINGGTIVVGAPRHMSVGAAYVFVEPTGGWQNATQTAELSSLPPQGTSSLGSAVAVENKIVLAGNPLWNGFNGGDVVGYEEPAGGWADTTTPDFSMIPSNTKQGASFGTVLAIDLPNILVGAPGGDIEGKSAGTAWVFGEQ
jgi:hypothetical protein